MGFETPPNGALQRGPGGWQEQTETDHIGHNPRGNQEQAGPENESGVDKLSGGRNAVVEVVLHLPQRPPAFQPGQIRANNTCADNQQDRQADSEDAANPEEEVQLRERDKGEYEEESKEHGLRTIWV